MHKQFAFPYTRQALKWSRFKRASRRAVAHSLESEWFWMALVLIVIGVVLRAWPLL